MFVFTDYITFNFMVIKNGWSLLIYVFAILILVIHLIATLLSSTKSGPKTLLLTLLRQTAYFMK